MTEEQKRKLLKEAQDRLRKAIEEDRENRRLALEDLEFMSIEGAQWPQQVKAEREAQGRPCLTINKMPVFVDQVVGDQRMNRPSIKVLPVDSKADPETARILGGWIKHVQQISKADIATDHAFEHAVACGYGAFRVVTRYTSDSAFEQDAYIDKIDNALSVFWGKHTEYDCSDALYCFIISDLDRDEFKQKYKKEPMPFNTADATFVEGWCTKDTVRVAEYFVKEPIVKTLYLLTDGRVVDTLKEGDIKAKERKVNAYKIMWYLLSGNDVLESREWPGKKYIPVIPVWGKEINVGGRRVIRGLIRHAKDPQRMYNYWQSCDTELVALQPKSPWLITPKQVEGHEIMWNNSHKENRPYLLANPDKEAPGWPHREPPPQMSTAMVQKLKETDQEMRDTVGLQKAALGMQSNERSGAAIRERKKEGDVGTFSFMDNLSRSQEQLGRILIDIAPSVLDTERRIRLGLANDEYEFSTVNLQTPDGDVLHDLAVGSYDITVVVGPSFTTQRTEAHESMKEFIQYFPQAAPYIGDLYAKTMDWPYADKIAQRLEFLLPPEVREKMLRDEAARTGRPAPPPADNSNSPQQIEMQMKIKESEIRLKESEIRLQQEQVKLQALIEENKADAHERAREFLQIDKLYPMLTEGEQAQVLAQFGIKKVGEMPDAETSKKPTKNTKVEKREAGGPVKSGKPYMVGENGPEVIVPKQDGTVIPNKYGFRTDGTPKGRGWLGEVPTTDGSGKVMTEYSISVGLDGKTHLIPSIVPTLTKDELDHIRTGRGLTDQIVHKAVEHAKPFIRSGVSPFAPEGEE